MASTVGTGFVTPGVSRGLLSVFSYRYLLGRLVRKEVGVRYRGSVLGWVWSFAKPAAQFAAYYVAMGIFLKVGASLGAYPIYLFSGLILLNFFSEAFGNATRSLVDNSPLIKKIYLPRELFPVSSTIVALVNFLPQVLVLLIVCLAVGWQPTILSFLALFAALALITLLAVGLGLLFSAINVSFRDSQNFVDLIAMLAVWLSPVFYPEDVLATAPEWVNVVYHLNPITPAVELMHYAFWASTPQDPSPVTAGFSWFTLIAFGVALALVAIGQLVFRRLEGRFAQDL